MNEAGQQDDEFNRRLMALLDAGILVPLQDPADGPGPEAWGRLIARLAQIATVSSVPLDDPELTAPQFERVASIEALLAVVEYLNTDLDVLRSGLARPLMALSGDLIGLENGAQSARLTPNTQPKKEDSEKWGFAKVRMPLDEHAMRSSAVLAVEELMEAGHTLKEATRIVASAVQKSGLKRRGDGDLPRAVQNWRDHAKVPRGGAAHKEALEQWRDEFAQRIDRSAQPQQRADYLLRLIERMKPPES